VGPTPARNRNGTEGARADGELAVTNSNGRTGQEQPVTVDQVAEHFTAELAAGQMPSKRQSTNVS
jgi:hypothetical protein